MVFYFQDVLRPCVIDGYAVKKMRKLTLQCNWGKYLARLLQFCVYFSIIYSMTKSAAYLKRALDLFIVIVFSPIILVFMVVIALLIRITSGRGVIFRQERAGLNMKPFILYKFRTMKPTADPFGPSPKTGSDTRLTKTGKYLRLMSLDELPQFWNVIKGDMSLVGPRPLYMAQAQQWDQRQKKRLLVKPGLTGLAQISGRGSLTIEDKLELDVQYVENQSLLLDLKIILITIWQIFRPHHIYEKKYSRSQDTRTK